MASFTFLSHSVEETHEIAKDLFHRFGFGKLWYLEGPLGSGKTEFVRGLYAAHGQDPGNILSPSFTLLHQYPNFIHGDGYRLQEADLAMLREAGILDALMEPVTRVMEWPPDLLWSLQPPDIHLVFRYGEEDTRIIHIDSPKKKG